MKKLILIFIVLFSLLKPLSAQTKITKPKPKPELTPQTVTNVTNNVKMTAKGFVVESAYLIFDDETPVPSDNRVEINQRVNLRIIIDSGWNDTNGKVYPGASEKIILNTGYNVLKVDDLFEAYTETGVNPEDARYITLKAVITKIDDKKKHAIIFFKVWDKKGTSTITGNYKLFIK